LLEVFYFGMTVDAGRIHDLLDHGSAAQEICEQVVGWRLRRESSVVISFFLWYVCGIIK
jgi:hypothetical protein